MPTTAAALRLCSCLLVFACASPEPKTPSIAGPKVEPKAPSIAPPKVEPKAEPKVDTKPDAGPATDPCDPATLGLGAARLVPAWNAPSGCTVTGSATTDPVTVRTEKEFDRLFGCPADTDSGIDFSKHDLVVVDGTLSPAGAGTAIADDDTQVTLIARFRDPCADAPMPMPMPYRIAFLLPAGSTRSYGNTTCNLPKSCP